MDQLKLTAVCFSFMLLSDYLLEFLSYSNLIILYKIIVIIYLSVVANTNIEEKGI